MEMQERPDEKKEQQDEKFLSDTQKVVKKHLEDPNHQISEEDIKNVRIGMTPPDTLSQSDDPNAAIEERVSEITEDGDKNDDETPPSEDRITPWDVTT